MHCSSTLALYFISTVTNRCSCTVSEWLCVNWKRYSSVYNGVSDPQVFKRTKRSCSKTVFCRVLYVNINFFFFSKKEGRLWKKFLKRENFVFLPFKIGKRLKGYQKDCFYLFFLVLSKGRAYAEILSHKYSATQSRTGTPCAELYA